MNLQERTMQLQYHYYEEALIKGWRPAPQTLVNNKTQLGIERVQACRPLLANISRSRYNTPGSGNDVVADNVAYAAGASISSLVRGVFAGMRSACGVRWTWRITTGSATHFQCCHSNATRVPIANPPNSAQLGASATTPPSYIRVRATVWACGRGQTDRQTDARDHNTFRVIYDSREM